VGEDGDGRCRDVVGEVFDRAWGPWESLRVGGQQARSDLPKGKRALSKAGGTQLSDLGPLAPPSV
jgi:hypothetical protein